VFRAAHRRLVSAAALAFPLFACGEVPLSASIAAALDGARAPLVRTAAPRGEATSVAEASPPTASASPRFPWAFDTRPFHERQWSHVADADGQACRDALKEAGVKFRSGADQAEPNKQGCGIPHAVVVTKGATGIAYSPALTVDCSMALALVDFERLVQEEAERELGTTITRIRNLGSFACRNRKGWTSSKLSEHAFGVALDISAFEPKKGRAITVLKDYELGTYEPKEPRGRFLFNVLVRTRRDTPMTHIIGPEYNAAHRDHFHVDRGLPAWF
jgi:hypothetical protein